MEFNQIYSGRIDSLANGGEQSIKLKPTSGGRRTKGDNIQIVVRSSSGANVRLTAEVLHGPDGSTFVLHSTPINAADPGTSLPAVLNGDADSTKMLGEWT